MKSTSNTSAQAQVSEAVSTVISAWDYWVDKRFAEDNECDSFARLTKAMRDLAALSTPPARDDVAALAEAAWQILDDMGADGTCVCEAAKAKLRIAYEPFNDHEAEPDYTMDAAQSLARVRKEG